MATRFVFGPESAQFPSSSFPELKNVHSTERRMVLAFATGESCAWEVIAPQGLTGTLTAIVFYSMATDTTNVIRAGVSLEAITPADAVDLDSATSYDTQNAGSDSTVPGTAGHLASTSITLTNADSVAAGDLLRISVARITPGGTDATGDMHVHRVEIRDAA